MSVLLGEEQGVARGGPGERMVQTDGPGSGLRGRPMPHVWSLVKRGRVEADKSGK